MMMKVLKAAWRGVLYPLSNRFFLYVLFLNLISNYASAWYVNDWLSLFYICFLSAFIAYCEAFIYALLRPYWLKKAYAVFVGVLLNILCVTDYFLMINFQQDIYQDVIDILAETNAVEAAGFVETYMQFGTISLWVLACLALNVLLFFAVRYVYRMRYKAVALLLAFLGLLTFSWCVYGYAVYRNGMNIPQLTTLTRSGYALYLVKVRMQEIANLRVVNKNLKVSQRAGRKPTVVVVIGESFSVYHSSLYGYDKPTNPLLGKRLADGSLFLLNNAVTLEPFTTASMCADFSLDSLGVGFANKALFPACFRRAGYYTAMFDNQYFAGHGISFLADRELSGVLYDDRNTEQYRYDGDMVKTITPKNSPSLYIIHLYGQHYSYKERYPKAFSKFKAEHYPAKYSPLQRQIIAHYDNATLYNDYVVDHIMDKFKDEYCVVFYFSDHGEEVFEVRNYIGHGSAEHSPNPNYQLRIPFMVWLSPAYAEANPAMKEKLKAAFDYPVCADDVGHTLIDMAGITCDDFAPTRSFINDKFNKRRHRVVMHSVDYDASWIKMR